MFGGMRDTMNFISGIQDIKLSWGPWGTRCFPFCHARKLDVCLENHGGMRVKKSGPPLYTMFVDHIARYKGTESGP